MASANNQSPDAVKASGASTALSGVTVLEIAGAPGAGFTGSLLADFRATVWIGESLPGGSSMRALEPREWWSIAARNKQSVALDPAAPGAQEAITALLAKADMVVTDVAPVERKGHPWLRHVEGMAKKPLLVDVVPTGADRPELWPWSRKSDMAAAMTGMMALTGEADSVPVQPEFPLAEYLSGTLAALRAVAELRRARLTRTDAQELVVPLHQAVNRMIEWQTPIATAMGRPELRDGNTFPMNFSISNMFLTKDGKYIAVSAANDATAAKLFEMIGGPALRDDPRYSTTQARLKGLHEIYAILDKWIIARTSAQVLDEAARADVVLGQIYDAADIAADEHLRARGNIVELSDGRNKVPMPGIIPRVAGWEVAVRHLGPALGADTAAVLAACGVAPATIERLRGHAPAR
jgi:crotonobetainyl-CoA:carnitine CoA-transferase CaiB-like acyl-CoA transferase